jgi:hypothetical protein
MGLKPPPMPVAPTYAFQPKGRFFVAIPPVGLASRLRLGFVSPFTLTSALLTAPSIPARPNPTFPGAPERPALAP